MTDSLLVEALAKLAPNTIIALAVALFLRAVVPDLKNFLAHLTATLSAHEAHLLVIDAKIDNNTSLLMLLLSRHGVAKSEIDAAVKPVPPSPPPANARRSYSGTQQITQRTGTNG